MPPISQPATTTVKKKTYPNVGADDRGGQNERVITPAPKKKKKQVNVGADDRGSQNTGVVAKRKASKVVDQDNEAKRAKSRPRPQVRVAPEPVEQRRLSAELQNRTGASLTPDWLSSQRWDGQQLSYANDLARAKSTSFTGGQPTGTSTVTSGFTTDLDTLRLQPAPASAADVLAREAERAKQLASPLFPNQAAQPPSRLDELYGWNAQQQAKRANEQRMIDQSYSGAAFERDLKRGVSVAGGALQSWLPTATGLAFGFNNPLVKAVGVRNEANWAAIQARPDYAAAQLGPIEQAFFSFVPADSPFMTQYLGVLAQMRNSENFTPGDWGATSSKIMESWAASAGAIHKELQQPITPTGIAAYDPSGLLATIPVTVSALWNGGPNVLGTALGTVSQVTVGYGGGMPVFGPVLRIGGDMLTGGLIGVAAVSDFMYRAPMNVVAAPVGEALAPALNKLPAPPEFFKTWTELSADAMLRTTFETGVGIATGLPGMLNQLGSVEFLDSASLLAFGSLSAAGIRAREHRYVAREAQLNALAAQQAMGGSAEKAAYTKTLAESGAWSIIGSYEIQDTWVKESLASFDWATQTMAQAQKDYAAAIQMPEYTLEQRTDKAVALAKPALDYGRAMQTLNQNPVDTALGLVPASQVWWDIFRPSLLMDLIPMAGQAWGFWPQEGSIARVWGAAEPTGVNAMLRNAPLNVDVVAKAEEAVAKTTAAMQKANWLLEDSQRWEQGLRARSMGNPIDLALDVKRAQALADKARKAAADANRVLDNLTRENQKRLLNLAALDAESRMAAALKIDQTKLGRRNAMSNVLGRAATSTASELNFHIVPAMADVFNNVHTIEDARFIVAAMQNTSEFLKGVGGKGAYAWGSDMLRVATKNGQDALKLRVEPFMRKEVQRAFRNFQKVIPEFMDASEALRGTGPLNLDLLLGEIVSATSTGFARETSSAAMLASFPWGGVKARAVPKKALVQILDSEGKVIKTEIASSISQAARHAKEINAAIAGEKLFKGELLPTVGNWLRKAWAIPFIGWNPANLIQQAANPMVAVLTDGVSVFGENAKLPVLGKTRLGLRGMDEIVEHTAALFGGKRVGSRELSGMDASIYLGGSKKPTLASPLGPLYRNVEETMGQRVKYDGMVKFIQRYGRAVIDDVMIPELAATGLDPNMARAAGNAFYDAAYLGGSEAGFRAALGVLNQNVLKQTLSDFDPEWTTYLPVASARMVQQIIGTEADVKAAVAGVRRVLQDANKDWAAMTTGGPATASRHSFEAKTQTEDLAQLKAKANAAISNGGDEATIKAEFADVAKRQAETSTLLDGLMRGLAAKPVTGASNLVYNVWQAMRDGRQLVESNLNLLADKIHLAGGGEEWAKTYWPAARKAWGDYQNTIAKALQEAKAALDKGDMTGYRSPTQLIIDHAAHSDEWIRQQMAGLEPLSGKWDESFKQAQQLGRELEGNQHAFFMQAVNAAQVAPARILDELVSAERDLNVEGARVRAGLDEVLEKTVAAVAKATNDIAKAALWTDFFKTRNQAWRLFFGEFVPTRWGVAVKEAVASAGKQADTWLREFRMAGEIITPTRAKELQDNIRTTYGQSNIPSAGAKPVKGATPVITPEAMRTVDVAKLEAELEAAFAANNNATIIYTDASGKTQSGKLAGFQAGGKIELDNGLPIDVRSVQKIQVPNVGTLKQTTPNAPRPRLATQSYDAGTKWETYSDPHLVDFDFKNDKTIKITYYDTSNIRQEPYSDEIGYGTRTWVEPPSAIASIRTATDSNGMRFYEATLENGNVINLNDAVSAGAISAIKRNFVSLEDIALNTKGPVGSTTRANARKQFKEAFGLTDSHADAIEKLLNSRAKTWAQMWRDELGQQTGRLSDQLERIYYLDNFEKIVNIGEVGDRNAAAWARSVVADTPSLLAKAAQSTAPNMRTVIEVVSNMMTLTPDQRVIIAAHELSHAFHDDLIKAANMGVKRAEDMAVTLYEELGGKKWQPGMEIAWTPEDMERFAGAFERALKSGKAPTKGLKAVFDKFKVWFKQNWVGYQYVEDWLVARGVKKGDPVYAIINEMLGGQKANIPTRARVSEFAQTPLEPRAMRGVTNAWERSISPSWLEAEAKLPPKTPTTTPQGKPTNFDNAILNSLRKQLALVDQALVDPALVDPALDILKGVKRLQDIDPKYLPFLDELTKLHVIKESVREATKLGMAGVAKSTDNIYTALIEQLRASYVNIQRNMQESIAAANAAGNMKSPSMQHAGLWAMERLDKLGDTIEAKLRTQLPSETGVPNVGNMGNALPPAMVLKAQDYLGKQGLGYWNKVLYGANVAGDQARSFTMIDFWNKTRVDDILQLFMPFPFWRTRDMKNSIRRFVGAPGYVYHTERMKRALDQQHDNEQRTPERLRGYANITDAGPIANTLTGWLGNIFQLNGKGLDLSWYARMLPNRFLPTVTDYFGREGGYNSRQYTNNGDVATSIMTDMSGMGFNFFPPINEWYNQQINPDAQWRMADWTTQTRIAAWTAVRVADPSTWKQIPTAVRPDWMEHTIGREVANALYREEIDLATAMHAMDYLHQVFRGVAPLPEWDMLTEIEQKKVFAVLDSMSDTASSKQFVSGFTSWFTGVPVQAYDKAESAINELTWERSIMFYSAEKNKLGSKEAAYQFEAQNPPITGNTMKNAITRAGSTDPKATEKARPGVVGANALRRRDMLEAEKDKTATQQTAVDALLAENARATKTQMNQAKVNGYGDQPGLIDVYAQVAGQAAADAWLAEEAKNNKGKPSSNYVGLSKAIDEAVKAQTPSAYTESNEPVTIPGTPKAEMAAMLAHGSPWSQTGTPKNIAAYQDALSKAPSPENPDQLKADYQTNAIYLVRDIYPYPDYDKVGYKAYERGRNEADAARAKKLASLLKITEEAAAELLKDYDERFMSEAEIARREEIAASSGGGGGGRGGWRNYRRSSWRNYGRGGGYGGRSYGGGGGWGGGGGGGGSSAGTETDLLPSIASYFDRKRRLNSSLWARPRSKYSVG